MDPKNKAVANVRVAAEDMLDGFRRDLAPSDIDEVIGTSRQVKLAINDLGQVAGLERSLAQIAIGEGRLRRVSGAIAWIKEHFAEPLQVAALAKQVHMSPSALHSHFKAVAAMSPIQYQKRLRLEEARRLLLSEAASAESVAYEVGYASASQFSREYARLFGQPPRRDAERARAAVAGGSPFARSRPQPASAAPRRPRTASQRH